MKPTIGLMEEKESKARLLELVDSCASNYVDRKRRRCPSCDASRLLYCFDCTTLLLPKAEWPTPLQADELHLPFDLDIVLDDKPASSTGIHIATLLNTRQSAQDAQCRLIDVSKTAIPDYGSDEGVYFLFPDEDSVPLSSVDPEILKRLVVLDCKWTKSSIRLDPSLASLPKVHLDMQQESLYWRWHLAGAGMLSTAEAIYYAAWQVASAKGWSMADKDTLVYLLWTFCLQRERIRQQWCHTKNRTVNPHLPFSDEGKEFQRALRKKS